MKASTPPIAYPAIPITRRWSFVNSLSSAARRRSMPERPAFGEAHRDPVTVGGGDHLGVPDRAAGLDDRSDPGRGRVIHVVGEREEPVTRQNRAPQSVPRATR